MHKKWKLASCIVALGIMALPSWGQEWALLKAARQCAGSSVRVAQGKILAGGRPCVAAHAAQTARLRSLLTQQIKKQDWTKLPYVNPNISSIGVRTGKELYVRALKDFEALRKELNPVLFYQSNPQESRVMLPEEKRQWLGKIQAVQRKLAEIYTYIEPSETALMTAQAYVDEALHVLIPEINKMPLQKPQPRKDKQFRMDEFFLHDPKLGWLEKIRGEIPSAEHFEDLHVAVVNDEPYVREALKDAHSAGQLLPGGKLSVYADGKTLLEYMKTASDKPNFVLTDMSLPYSSGYLVVSELRRNGYQGPIVGFSAFQEREEIGREMFSYGLDGFISVSKLFNYAPFWYKRVNHKIANYFYYQNLGQDAR